jgi:hypothetical protein
MKESSILADKSYFERAGKLCPALLCGHEPGDDCQTVRLTARAEDLEDSEMILERPGS